MWCFSRLLDLLFDTMASFLLEDEAFFFSQRSSSDISAIQQEVSTSNVSVEAHYSDISDDDFEIPSSQKRSAERSV